MAKPDLGKTENFSIGHAIIRNVIFIFWFKVWYKNITVVGKKNVKKDVPTILAINHQNTAMDPLVIVAAIFRQTTWLTRADLFNNKVLVTIFHWFKMLPIYRQRDGRKALENNDMVFEKVVDTIAHKRLVGLFPEGTHWGYRRLRSTRKAIPRIVHMAEEKYNYDMDINVNPIGIYYDDYIDVRTDVFVKIGEPIPMRPFFEKLKENPQNTGIEIHDSIEEGLRANMLDIPQTNEDEYHTVNRLRCILRKKTLDTFLFKGNKQERQYNADRKTIEIIEKTNEKDPSFITSLIDRVKDYDKKLKDLRYTDTIVSNEGGDAFQILWNCMKAVVLLPFFICGFITYALSYWLVNKAGNKFTKDILFKNSIMFVLSLFLGLITHIVLVILWLIFVPLPWWTMFFVIMFLFYIWTVFIDYPRLIKNIFMSLRFNAGIMTKDDGVQSLINARKELESIYEQHLH